MVVSKCNDDHNHGSLVCKTKIEFETFYENPAKYFFIYILILLELIRNSNFLFLSRWFCHLDDDNYLNVKQLYNFLEKYNPTKSYYFGKKSLNYKMSSEYNKVIYYAKTTNF